MPPEIKKYCGSCLKVKTFKVGHVISFRDDIEIYEITCAGCGSKSGHPHAIESDKGNTSPRRRLPDKVSRMGSF